MQYFVLIIFLLGSVTVSGANRMSMRQLMEEERAAEARMRAEGVERNHRTVAPAYLAAVAADAAVEAAEEAEYLRYIGHIELCNYVKRPEAMSAADPEKGVCDQLSELRKRCRGLVKRYGAHPPCSRQCYLPAADAGSCSVNYRASCSRMHKRIADDLRCHYLWRDARPEIRDQRDAELNAVCATKLFVNALLSKDAHGLTPLMHSVLADNAIAIRLILAFSRTEKEEHSLTINARHACLVRAAEHGFANAFKALLEHVYGTSPGPAKIGLSPVEFVVKGVDPFLHEEKPEQKTILMYAAMGGSLEIINMIKAKRPWIGRFKTYVNRQDARGWTALMYAAHHGHEAAVKYLLDRGADGALTNSDGQVAVAIAQAAGHNEVAVMLGGTAGDYVPLGGGSDGDSVETGSDDVAMAEPVVVGCVG